MQTTLTTRDFDPDSIEEPRSAKHTLVEWQDALYHQLRGVVSFLGDDEESDFAHRQTATAIADTFWRLHQRTEERITDQRAKVRAILRRNSSGTEIDGNILDNMVAFGHRLRRQADVYEAMLEQAAKVSSHTEGHLWANPAERAEARKTQSARTHTTSSVLAAMKFAEDVRNHLDSHDGLARESQGPIDNAGCTATDRYFEDGSVELSYGPPSPNFRKPLSPEERAVRRLSEHRARENANKSSNYEPRYNGCGAADGPDDHAS